ncbi:MAG: hypothetical protein V7K21_23695 [Nostoc sp.]|uniref:hypothetical protein n=1 Tax=Nostoc sp. TaxID=1180 RepID=UPI002FF859B7
MSSNDAFKPAFDSEGYTEVTLLEYKLDSEIDKKTGEDKEYMCFTFSIMDFTCKKSIKTNVFISTQDKAIRKLLSTLNISTNLYNSAYNSFEQLDYDFDESDDDFEDVDGYLFRLKILEVFIPGSTISKTYLAKVAPNKNGYWIIDTKSLKQAEPKPQEK